MKAPWSSDLPVVHVALTSQAKAVTMVLPYYENPGFLRQQVGWWCTLPPHMLDHLSVILVDDGSPETPATTALKGLTVPVSIRVFRVAVDVRWNWIAARNIGAHHAPDGWMVMTDMDHVIPQATMEALIYGQHDTSVIYGFSRIEWTGDKVSPHPNSWFLTRQMFWQMGGYDETLSGHYGTDGDIRRRLKATAPLHILEDRLVRHEHQGDSSTTRYLRKQPQDSAVKRLISARKPGWRPKVLSFPYAEVAL